MRQIITLFLMMLLAPAMSWANRVAEVEDYYSERVSKFIQSRFPNQAFTVMTLVDVAKPAKSESKSTSLPYLEIVDKETDIWSKADVPLSTLVSYVDKVSIKVDLENDLDANELNLLHTQLFEYLKLSSATDKIEIKKMIVPVKPQDKNKQTNWWLLGSAIAAASLFVLFMLVSWGIRSLVKGLSTPLSEIGKSAQHLANNPIANTTSFQEQKSLGTTAGRSDSSYESRRLFKEMFEENKEVFEKPSLEILDFLENEGRQNPASLTALFVEIKKDNLRDLFSFGTGDWWFEALAQPPQITDSSLDVLYRVHQLKIKNQFADGKKWVVDSDLKDFPLILNRLSENQLETILKGYSFSEVAPLLRCLPKSKGMKVCKSLFPGNWAQFLDIPSGKEKISSSMAKQIQTKALQLYPLRDVKSIETFFNQVEIERYLDNSNTWDEREFYKALAPDSSIKQKRQPFYALFDLPPEAFKALVESVSIQDWALVLRDCERQESSKIFDVLTERQRFALRELLKNSHPNKTNSELKALTKLRIVNLMIQQQNIKNTIESEQKAA